MCGICGYLGLADDELVTRMTDILEHRGPDDFGYFHDGDVHLGHRRLSIIDIAGGRQPMMNRDGSLVIIYNGEIYNFREIKPWLAARGHRFRTSSDTEVLLLLYEELGPKALDKLNGMFAFAIYDRHKKELFLARDRIGIKPLYYLQVGNRFLFASESKALLTYRDWSPTINPMAIDDYLRLRYVPGSTTMFRELKRLPAGHYLRYSEGRLSIERYWEPSISKGPYNGKEETYIEELGDLLEASVRRRLISDVPFGAYLSGGIDSSVIVALMSKMVSNPVKTFSVGFDYEHDELNQAAFTAKHLGCDHHEIPCRAEDISLLPQIVFNMDEPMGDAITIPMYQLSKAAKRKVTVILTGEGGDEIFGGYLFHKLMWFGNLYQYLTPKFIQHQVLLPLLSTIPPRMMNKVFQYPAYLGDRGKQKALDYLLLLEPSQMDQAYRHLISLFDSRDTIKLYSPQFTEQIHGAHPTSDMDIGDSKRLLLNNKPYFNQLLHLQFKDWLPDNMLLRQDKTGMANAIEGRVPYLDHTLVEFALRLPPNLKLRHLVGKYILRKFAGGILPKEVTNRKKMPFYVPIENFFEQPIFQEQMNEFLSETSVRNRGIFRPEGVRQLKQAMDRREFMLVKQVFSLMVLEMWFRIFVDGTISI
ncbi:MAG: asparagine synthase (glutamine-hydrolyzing) [Thermodesulfobacteriota bacterium]|nr:asparagine synthase (glutamine-hydrolyzing) [Thermodesulfobacteriota bacterium]